MTNLPAPRKKLTDKIAVFWFCFVVFLQCRGWNPGPALPHARQTLPLSSNPSLPVFFLFGSKTVQLIGISNSTSLPLQLFTKSLRKWNCEADNQLSLMLEDNSWYPMEMSLEVRVGMEGKVLLHSKGLFQGLTQRWLMPAGVKSVDSAAMTLLRSVMVNFQTVP